eukprot:3617713-Pleurochrysis_carterae.AAC.1
MLIDEPRGRLAPPQLAHELPALDEGHQLALHAEALTFVIQRIEIATRKTLADGAWRWQREGRGGDAVGAISSRRRNARITSDNLRAERRTEPSFVVLNALVVGCVSIATTWLLRPISMPLLCMLLMLWRLISVLWLLLFVLLLLLLMSQPLLPLRPLPHGGGQVVVGHNVQHAHDARHGVVLPRAAPAERLLELLRLRDGDREL